jgi:hypothetical protein
MAPRKLDKNEWKPYLDALSKLLGAKQVEIEVLSLRLGEQIEAEWVPFIGIVYDPKDDIVEVALEGVDHLIPKPREIWVDDLGANLSSIAVVDGDGNQHLIRLKEPLMLPAPAHGA